MTEKKARRAPIPRPCTNGPREPPREKAQRDAALRPSDAALATLLAHIKQHFGALQPAFLAMDVNRDRVISCEEFRRGVHMAKLELTDGEIDAIFQALDNDGSGELDYQELCRRFSAADLKRAQSHARPLRRDESRSPQADAISPQQEQADAVRTESAELQRVRQLQEEAEAMEKQRRVLANKEARARLQSLEEEQHLRRQLQVAQDKERRQADLKQARLEHELEIQRRRAKHSRGDSRERAR
jgi:hypothetical protein